MDVLAQLTKHPNFSPNLALINACDLYLIQILARLDLRGSVCDIL